MTTQIHNVFGNLPYFIAHLMTVSLRVTEKKKVNQDREQSQHIFRFFLHIQVIHEKKKKTNKLNIILSQENYHLSGQQHSR